MYVRVYYCLFILSFAVLSVEDADVVGYSIDFVSQLVQVATL